MRTASDVAPLLPHPDESAGGRMTSDFVALHQEWTVDEALAYLRDTRPAADQAYYLYVVGPQHTLEGVVSLRSLVVAGADERIGELMTPEVVSVGTTEDQEEVARRVQRYNFIALPVVDEGRRLVGVISVDDVLDVAEEEATEDMYRMAGLDEEESLLRPVGRSIVPRLGWLLVALVSFFAAAGVVSAFEGTIERVVALAVFMPVIAGLGGNAGVQTITLVVRSLALGHVEVRDVRRILGRELVIGISNGVVIGLLLGVLAFAWKGNVGLGVVAGLAMLLSMSTAVTAGVLVPLTLRALRLDPALASGVLVTTVTDILGFFFFLGLATLMVERIA
jgi:magnesium transporter